MRTQSSRHRRNEPRTSDRERSVGKGTEIGAAAPFPAWALALLVGGSVMALLAVRRRRALNVPAPSSPWANPRPQPRRKQSLLRLVTGGRTEAHGIKVGKTFTVNRRPEDLYHHWRDFRVLVRSMEHIESIEMLDDKRSHWTLIGPMGKKLTWDAVITGEKENEFISWRTLEGSDIDHRGAVFFYPKGEGTEIKVSLNYDPPGGKLGSVIAKLFGQDAKQQIQEGLRHLKQLMETGEIPTTDGQPMGK